jgi:hypothetical protein
MQCSCTHDQTACIGPILLQHSDYFLYDCQIHITWVYMVTLVNQKQQQERLSFRSLKKVEHVFSI